MNDKVNLTKDNIKVGLRVKHVTHGMATIIAYPSRGWDFDVKFDNSISPIPEHCGFNIAWSIIEDNVFLTKEDNCKFCKKPNEHGVTICWNCYSIIN